MQTRGLLLVALFLCAASTGLVLLALGAAAGGPPHCTAAGVLVSAAALVGLASARRLSFETRARILVGALLGGCSATILTVGIDPLALADLPSAARSTVVLALASSALVLGFVRLPGAASRGPESPQSLALDADSLADASRSRARAYGGPTDREAELLASLAAFAAHDFNNALYVIQGNAELARRAHCTPPEVDAALAAIEAAARDATATSRQLITLVGTSAGRTCRRTCLASEVRRAAQLLERILPRTIHLQLCIERTPPIHASEGAIQRVLMNLALNARDAMPDGGTLELRVRTARVVERASLPAGASCGTAAYAALDVIDTGCGMDRRTLEHLFEPYFSTKGAGGSGLGLASTHELVRDMRGSIQVESTPGGGTRFTLYWPAEPTEPGARAGLEPSPAPSSGQVHSDVEPRLEA